MKNLFEEMSKNYEDFVEKSDELIKILKEEEEIKQRDRFHDEHPEKEEKPIDLYDFYGVSERDFH